MLSCRVENAMQNRFCNHRFRFLSVYVLVCRLIDWAGRSFCVAVLVWEPCGELWFVHGPIVMRVFVDSCVSRAFTPCVILRQEYVLYHSYFYFYA